MPVHVKREPDALLVVFERDGEEPATRHASGRRAGVRLLIGDRALRVGDRLTARRRRTIKQSSCIDGRRRHHLKGPSMKLFTGICLMIILASCAGPAPYGPESYGPESYGPESYGPGPYGPESYGPGPYGPAPYGPESYGPGPYGPAPYGPESYGPDSYGPAPYGPESYGPGPYASAVQPAMSGPQLPVSYQRKCYDCLPWRQDAYPK
jgi:hypothetical protein